jgi:hypothetical protein
VDPDTALDELLALAARLDATEDITCATIDPAGVARLAELVQALDGWIMAGGYLPSRWAAGLRRRGRAT